MPFNLNECEAFFKYKGASFQRYQIVQLYMALGGIPFYLEMVDKGQSATQNIHELCFKNNGRLQTEFEDLYASLFNNPQKHLAIIHALSTQRKGLILNDILRITKLPNAGSTTRILTELIEGGFVKQYVPFGGKKQNRIFQLIDFYSLFYFNFIHGKRTIQINDWILAIDDPAQSAWSGYAFEMICLQHIAQIKKALSIGGVQTQSASWVGSSNDRACQIDLIIDRKDDVVNLCEFKYSKTEFVITKKYANEILNKVSVFREATGTKKSIFMTFVTTYGVKSGSYKQELVQNDLTMEDLFLPM